MSESKTLEKETKKQFRNKRKISTPLRKKEVQSSAQPTHEDPTNDLEEIVVTPELPVLQESGEHFNAGIVRTSAQAEMDLGDMGHRVQIKMESLDFEDCPYESETEEFGMKEVDSGLLQNSLEVLIKEENNAIPQLSKNLLLGMNQQFYPYQTNNYTCDICERNFAKKHKLISHIERNCCKKLQLVKCQYCPEKYYKKYLQVHERCHTGEKPFECDICHKKFGQRSTLTRHKLIHNEQKPFSCDTCGQGFNGRSSMIRHRLTHTTEKLFPCDMCDRSYKDMSSLERHIDSNHSNKLYLCPYCDKTYTNNYSLQRHALTHGMGKVFSCDMCKKSFPEEAKLKSHKRVHSKERPYQCVTCEAKFSDRSTLSRHKKLHTGEKKYLCDICFRRFYRLANLSSHRLIHSEIRPFLCEICDKSFTQSTGLKSHLRIHNLEKTFSCDQCEKKFLFQSKLVAHSRVHTGEKPFLCHVCKKTFTEKSSLTSHMKRHHTGQVSVNINVDSEFSPTDVLDVIVKIEPVEEGMEFMGQVGEIKL